jgi:hypothetical protein
MENGRGMKTCRRCGCNKDIHLHYNSGTYCGNCGREVCPQFKPIRWYHYYWNRRPYAKRIGLLWES